MPVIFPEIEEMKKYKQYFLHHPEGATMRSVANPSEIAPLMLKDIETGSHVVNECSTVFDHVMAVMKCIPADADEFVVLGALYHDIGKPASAEPTDPVLGTSSFKRHEYIGLKIFEEIAKKRKFGKPHSDFISFCIGEHMNMNNHALCKKSTITNMAINPFFDKLVEVSRADDMSRNTTGNTVYSAESFNANLKKFIVAREHYSDISSFKAKIANFIDGNKVMKMCNLKPSKNVGIIISEVTEWLIEADFNVAIEEVDAKIMAVDASLS